MLRDGAPMRLAQYFNFQGLHVGVPLDGVAVHINAFNFPAWGLWEAAVSLLAGVPVFAKLDLFQRHGSRRRWSAQSSTLAFFRRERCRFCAARPTICSITFGWAMLLH